MPSATCHCGAVCITVPALPTEITNCNCSICRRLGALWGYYDVSQVQVQGHPEHTQGYVQGDRTLRTVRCKTCGCTLLWEPLATPRGARMGVNMRNFDPTLVGRTRMRLLDGAHSWDASFWEPPA
jgi:hypothetical protein